MIVLSGKKILFNIGIIIMFVFTYMITAYNVEKSNALDMETVQTVALPVDNKVIIIDARPSGFRMRELKVVLAQQKRRVI